MKVNGYGAWPLWNESTGGQKPSYDPYNRHLKKERFPRAEEYASMNVEEYHHYSEYNDITSIDRNKNRQNSNRSKNSHSSRIRIVQQVVCLVAGSTIIVSTYQAMTKPQETVAQEPTSQVVEQQPDVTEPEEELIPVVASTKWIWSDDNSSVSVQFFDSDGNLIREAPGEILVTTLEPTCNKEGLKTYTATATFEREEFTDSREETLSPLGHAFDEGKEVTLDNGKSAKVFECSRCHEKFTFQTEMTEND